MSEIGLQVGPLQILTFGLENPQFDGRIVDEIIALEEAGIALLIDAALVIRESDDEFTAIDVDVEIFAGRPMIGSIIGSLIGFGATGEDGAELGAELGEDADLISSDDLLDMLEDIPTGGAAAVIVLQHLWAGGLMAAIRASGGFIIADDILHAEDAVEFGLELGDAFTANGETDQS
jgi:hypothetical protein